MSRRRGGGRGRGMHRRKVGTAVDASNWQRPESVPSGLSKVVLIFRNSSSRTAFQKHIKAKGITRSNIINDSSQIDRDRYERRVYRRPWKIYGLGFDVTVGVFASLQFPLGTEIRFLNAGGENIGQCKIESKKKGGADVSGVVSEPVAAPRGAAHEQVEAVLAAADYDDDCDDEPSSSGHGVETVADSDLEIASDELGEFYSALFALDPVPGSVPDSFSVSYSGDLSDFEPKSVTRFCNTLGVPSVSVAVDGQTLILSRPEDVDLRDWRVNIITIASALVGEYSFGIGLPNKIAVGDLSVGNDVVADSVASSDLATDGEVQDGPTITWKEYEYMVDEGYVEELVQPEQIGGCQFLGFNGLNADQLRALESSGLILCRGEIDGDSSEDIVVAYSEATAKYASQWFYSGINVYGIKSDKMERLEFFRNRGY